MKKTVRQLAELSGISVRTLHYYDEIGLLCPSELTEAGYRLYDDAALLRLRQILFFRELGFPLKEIGEFLDSPSFDERGALENQRDLLLLKRQRLDGIIGLVERLLKGEQMTDMKAFDQSGIEAAKRKYAKEAKERWGGTDAYQQSEERAARYTPADWDKIQAGMDEIFSAFAALRGQDPGCEEAEKLVRRWQDFLTEHFYDCSDEILLGLGEMYVGDQRFLKNLDTRYGEGTAATISAAIHAACGDVSDTGSRD
ncbi:MerR family transcriptional regulator [Oscillospiraceae bacterium NSJ-54]|uniref:MerR family transcriptional regulator n=2 Tax=Zongyangia hominis TaxID=2763677 RepID=A0A926EDY0_9FIRM|nr:MerR family transcriptional regulator [Zongyangia hominis]